MKPPWVFLTPLLWSTIASAVQPMTAVGESHACLLTLSGNVRCWGDDTYGQTRVPKLKQVIQIQAGSRHTCALMQDGKITCWGQGVWNQVVDLDSKNTEVRPSKVFVGEDGRLLTLHDPEYHPVLAAYDCSLPGHCSSTVLTPFPSPTEQYDRKEDVIWMNRINSVSLRGEIYCLNKKYINDRHTLLNKNNISVCGDLRDQKHWLVLKSYLAATKRNSWGSYIVPPSYYPDVRDIANNSRFFCELNIGNPYSDSPITPESIRCSVFNNQDGALSDSLVKDLETPRFGKKFGDYFGGQVVVGERHVCASKGGQVECWGDNTLGQLEIPALLKARSLSAFGANTCALVDSISGVTCWGPITQYSIPRNVIVDDIPEEVKPSKVLQPIYDSVSTARANLIELAFKLAPEKELTSAEARIFVMYALKPLLQSIDSKVIQEELYPPFDSYLARVGAKFGIQKVSDIEPTPQIRLIALEMLNGSFQQLQTLLPSPQDLAEVSEIRTTIGAALAREANPESIRQVLRTIDSKQRLMDLLSRAIPTRGFGKMNEEIVKYLKQGSP